MEEAAYWLMAMKAQLKSDVFMRLLRSAYEDYGPALTNKMMTLDPEESTLKTAWKALDAQQRLDAQGLNGGGGKEEEEGGPAYVQHTNQEVYDDILRRMKNDDWVVVKHYLSHDQQG